MRQLLSAAKEYIKNKAIAEIYVEGETWRYQLLKESDEFLFVHNCYDWHFCEYIVFVKKYLTEASLKYGRLEAFRNRLFWSLKQCKCEADWIDLTSFNALFQSIRDNYNKISIYESTKKSNTFLMGKIAKYDDKYLHIIQVTPMGKTAKNKSRREIDKITKISFADRYGETLFRYAESAKQ